MKTENTNEFLREKFRLLIYHLRVLDEAKKRKVFDAIIKGTEFKNAIRTLRTVCDEACWKESMKMFFLSAITSFEAGIMTKDHAALHKFIRNSEFRRSIRTFEKIYKEIYGTSDDYENGYQQFSEEINNLSEDVGIPMWLKIFVGAGVLGGTYGVYRAVKKHNKDSVKE